MAGKAGVPINTDDRNVVEFGFARSVGTSASLLGSLRNAARAAGHGRPLFSNDPSAPVNWDAVDTRWLAYQVTEGQLAGVTPAGPPLEMARQTALLQYYSYADVAAARAAWHGQARAPIGPTELAMAADLEAERGSDSALSLIDELRTYTPGEADTILAGLRFRQSRFDDAGAALEEAFENFKTDPWALTRFKQRAIALAATVATRSPQLALRMMRALQPPFAVRTLDDERLIIAASLTQLIGFDTSCKPAVAPLEPHVPWTRAFLTLRRSCYQTIRDPRLATAERDLNAFLAGDRPPLAGGFCRTLHRVSSRRTRKPARTTSGSNSAIRSERI